MAKAKSTPTIHIPTNWAAMLAEPEVVPVKKKKAKKGKSAPKVQQVPATLSHDHILHLINVYRLIMRIMERAKNADPKEYGNQTPLWWWKVSFLPILHDLNDQDYRKAIHEEYDRLNETYTEIMKACYPEGEDHHHDDDDEEDL